MFTGSNAMMPADREAKSVGGRMRHDQTVQGHEMLIDPRGGGIHYQQQRPTTGGVQQQMMYPPLGMMNQSSIPALGSQNQ